MSNRKRRAPGASPHLRQQSDLQNNIYTQDAGSLGTESYLSNWNDPSASADLANAFAESSLFDGTGFSGNINSPRGHSTHSRVISLDGLNDVSSANPTPSGASYPGQLVRRNPNQQLAARARTPWDAFNELSPGQQGGWEHTDDDEDLEQKALLARKDAQAKRKQIPPFVQKLSSFLDEKNNTNLIRWSDDGNSFIVLDEDEFARTLIPELFKHNNYASFVRQLNMYGFHKKVGLSDNSMKASETKAKAPSEYFNKYFKRGRPELLWLIQKPKNAASNPKRKRDDDNTKQGDSDDDGRRYVTDSGGGPSHQGEDSVAVRNQEMAMIPRTEYNNLRNEVRALQQQQKIISGVLNRIRQQNDQLYQQATAFQTLHDRHENSINAILTFLATFYNRSLEGNHMPNVADMFSHNLSQSAQPHGNVVDVDDYPEKSAAKSPQLHRTPRRPLALLPAPTSKGQGVLSGRAATVSPSIRSAASPISRPSPRPSVFKPVAQTTRDVPHASTPLNTPVGPGAASAFQLNGGNAGPQEAFTQPPQSEEIMSAIQNINASTQGSPQGPQFDFSSALNHFQTADGNVPLTQQQRNNVLSHMANNTDAISSGGGRSQSNNALVSPQPPTMPSLDQFAATQSELDVLQKLSEEQNSRLQHVQQRLEPLSPSSSIPGLAENSYFSGGNLGEPAPYDLNHDLDLNSFVQGDEFFQTTENGAGGTGDLNLPDLNYQLPSAEEMTNGLFEDVPGTNVQDYTGAEAYERAGQVVTEGGTIESLSSSATSPAATVHEEAGEDNERSPKRRRKVNP
ncbi:hypothetical protein GQ43DRAFT_376583 [Delitschia confertaspora ATCC 74209]|uniref:HSF-type DNA-binding domain-containing protein n=1 Tax=Delitschia confertaspora ATCC 74209 TaxID=1513339 RepID=A0A9P4MTQ8_9PLEO|nr:hypothetical protein GQ43DRAFT_376583 [Delitschia confertaspora ATCC 74209]